MKMRIEPTISDASVVLLGDFNPVIFTPAWFALQELLPKSAAEHAEVEVASPKRTAFSTEWLHLQVKAGRFEASAQQAPYVRLRDLLVRAFTERLRDTPLKGIGINRNVLFPVASRVERDRIRTSLATLEAWEPCKELLALDGDRGGVTSLTMTQFRPEGRPPGRQVNVRVDLPSRVDDELFAISVRVNDHYAVDREDIDGRERLMGFLHNDFEPSLRRGDGIVEHVMSLATGQRGAGS